MKIILLLFFLVILSGRAWATPDWTPSTEYSTSTQVTINNAAVCSVVVTGVGVTAGDMIVLQNSSTGLNPNANELTVVAGSSNFTTPVNYNGSPCNLFTNGLYVDDYVHSGRLSVDLQYLNAI